MSAEDLSALALPDGGAFPRGRSWSSPRARGRAYASVPASLAAAVDRWLEHMEVPEGVPLKGPDVHRVGSVVVKFFRQPSLLGWFRHSRAVRSAERHFWCRPIRSPRPWLAAARRTGRPSLLVREHVEGRLLHEVWGREELAEERLAGFLADLDRHSIVHGDLHPRNLMWTGAEWILLDIDGIRHGLHSVERGLCGQWARLLVHLGDEERVRHLHSRAGEALGRPPRASWDEVLARAARLHAQRRGVPPR